MSILVWVIILVAVLVILVWVAISVALQKRDSDMLQKTGEFDLSGKTYRGLLREKARNTTMDLSRVYTEEVEALQRFQPVINNTQCPFAKTANVISSRDWDERLSLEDNVGCNVKLLTDFLQMGQLAHFDGFVLEIRGEQYHNTVEQFGDSVRRVLCALSDADPKKVHCMRRRHIDKKGWWFEFAGEPIFLTTFAPIYPSTHSRHQFHAPKDSSFVLFQPEYSFAWKNIPCYDDPVTQWENPVTLRDKIRVAFRSAGRPYMPLKAVPYGTTADHIVRPLEIMPAVLRWWSRDNEPS